MRLLSVYVLFFLLAVILAQLISSNANNLDDLTTSSGSVPVLRVKRQYWPWGWGRRWGWRRRWWGNRWGWRRYPWGWRWRWNGYRWVPYYGRWGR